MNFIPENLKSSTVQVPYFEDVKASDIPGRGTEKSLQRLQDEASQMLMKLGAGGIYWVQGTFPGTPERFGFQIHFNYNGIPGRIDCAALPLRGSGKVKKDRALAQAVYLVRNWLEAEVYAHVYRPGAVPLVPYLLGEGGKTVTEALIESRALPMLGGGK